MPKRPQLRTANRKAKSTRSAAAAAPAPALALEVAARETARLWRRHHLTYAQVCEVAKRARVRLELGRPRRGRGAVDRLSRAEVDRVIGEAYRQGGARGLLVKTLLYSGLRVSEFAALEVGDLLLDEALLHVRHGKGDKARYVPILPELAQEIRTHVGAREVGYLFESNRADRFTPRRVQQLVKAIAAAAGVAKRVHPHLLRHTVAQVLLERGMSLEQLQKFLGHASIETTTIYAESNTAAVASGYRRALRR